MEREWRKALQQPFRDLRTYAEKLEKVEQDGIDLQAWFRVSGSGNSRAYQEGFRAEYDRLYSDLSWGATTFHMHGRFEPFEIEKLEEELLLLQAKLKAACECLDREHALTMDERRRLR